jgi:hypothetical protein
MLRLIKKRVYTRWKNQINEAVGEKFFPDRIPYNSIVAPGEDTLAHYAAALATHTRLPESFQDWTLPGKKGFIVAHIAAITGKLPETFSRWDILEDKNTVLHSLARYNPEDFFARMAAGAYGVEALSIRGKYGSTVAMHLTESKGGGLELPPTYNGWLDIDYHGVTAARYLLRSGYLNNHFAEWDSMSAFGMFNRKNLSSGKIFLDANKDPYSDKYSIATIAGMEIYRVTTSDIANMSDKSREDYAAALRMQANEGLELLKSFEVNLAFNDGVGHVCMSHSFL